jgi:hypothetical protein
MLCPTLTRRRKGISTHVNRAVARQAAAMVKKMRMMFI